MEAISAVLDFATNAQNMKNFLLYLAIILAMILLVVVAAKAGLESFRWLRVKTCKHEFKRDDYAFYEFDEDIHYCKKCGHREDRTDAAFTANWISAPGGKLRA